MHASALKYSRTVGRSISNMAKATKKKAKTTKKSARVSSKPKSWARTAKPARKAAKPSRRSAKKSAAPKIDPLNRKNYGAVTPMLAVRDIRGAVDFYKSALGFTVRSVMDGPEGPLHAELRLR